MKICSICKTAKDPSAFGKRDNRCRRCRNDVRNAQRALLGRTAADGKRGPRRAMRSGVNHVITPGELLRLARTRAKRKGVPFDLTRADIVIPEICPALGIDITARPRKAWDHTASLDRLDPARGYVPGNVWVISLRANMMKRDATLAELEALVSAVRTKLSTP